MATTLPRPRTRRPRNRPVAGRAQLPEVYLVKKIDNSRLRREVDPQNRRQCFSLLGLGILVFLFGLLFAYQHFQCVRYGYQIEQLKGDLAKLDEWNHQLSLDQATLVSPVRIDRLARQRLGFVAPGPHQVTHLDLGETTAASTDNSELARNFLTAPHNTSHGP